MLASIHDEDTNNFISSMTSDRIWLGGYSDNPPDTTSWTWADGSAWDFANWGGQQPDFKSEPYLELNFGGAGRWNNVFGGSRRKNTYVCQASPVKA